MKVSSEGPANETPDMTRQCRPNKHSRSQNHPISIASLVGFAKIRQAQKWFHKAQSRALRKVFK